MIHEVMIIIYRVIVLAVLGCTVWTALDEETSGQTQIIAALLVIPLVLRVLMIK
jgi:MFS-type transporter involved in bile tolerance (Atg22 family)